MHPSPALVPRLTALVRAKATPPPFRFAIEHAETHAPLASRVARQRTDAAPQHSSYTPLSSHPQHPHPLNPHSHPSHPFRHVRKLLFFTTEGRRTEPLPAPMIAWNDHLSMV